MTTDSSASHASYVLGDTPELLTGHSSLRVRQIADDIGEDIVYVVALTTEERGGKGKTKGQNGWTMCRVLSQQMPKK